jgi:hypothetical protein
MKVGFLEHQSISGLIPISHKKSVTARNPHLCTELVAAGLQGHTYVSGTINSPQHHLVLLVDLCEGSVGYRVACLSHPGSVQIVLFDAPLLLLTRFADGLFHGVDHVDRLNDNLTNCAVAIDQEALDVAIDYLNWRCGAVTEVEMSVGVASGPLDHDLRLHIGGFEIVQQSSLLGKEGFESLIRHIELLKGGGVEYMLPQRVEAMPRVFHCLRKRAKINLCMRDSIDSIDNPSILLSNWLVRVLAVAVIIPVGGSRMASLGVVGRVNQGGGLLIPFSIDVQHDILVDMKNTDKRFGFRKLSRHCCFHRGIEVSDGNRWLRGSREAAKIAHLLHEPIEPFLSFVVN